MSSASMHAPAIGLGTWRMGESVRQRTAEIAAVRQAIELGYRLFDTAEMYGEGGAESMLGQALREAIAAGDVKRSELTVVSKVYPHNASRKGTVAACERSLKRLGLDAIDVYLLHWPGSHPLQETVEAFEALKAGARITAWGVSNFDVAEMQALWAVDRGPHCCTNQVWYSLSRRGADFDLRPWLRNKGLPLMAYSPIDQAALVSHTALARIGQRIGATAAQVALAWTLRDGDVVAIPKSARLNHLRDNLAAAQIKLDADALKAIDEAFPPPKRKQSLAIN
jgi:diketogulonate reductase-like aldo/keto reductase